MTRRADVPKVTAAAAVLLGAALLIPTAAAPAAAQTGAQTGSQSGGQAGAQPGAPIQPVLTNVIPESDAVTVHAKITAVDPATRKLTLADRSGKTITLTAGPGVRLDMLKVGDTVDAQYYRSVAFVVSPPGAPAPKDEMEQALARPVSAPGGISMSVTQISGLVVGIDLNAHSIEVVNPQGGEVVTINVTNPERQAMLPMLKVGDTITAVISQALAVSVQPAKKSLF